MGEGCYIGDFAVVEAGVKIGNGCQIYPQVYLGTGVSVGEGTILYPGVKVYEGCCIGRNCILHAGAVIGADGFGFMPNAAGGFDKIPQLGNVVIEDDVEIGANTCIDRAKTDSTVIRRGVKLDNLIQIGHNVQVGENTVSSAQTGIAGTSKVGSNCFLAGQVGIADHVNVGNNVKIGSKSGLDKDVPDGEIRFGYPALPGMQYHRSATVFKRLPELEKRVNELEKQLAASKNNQHLRIMKNLFLFATAAAVLCSCSNQPKYIIDGDIAGLEGTVYLYQGDSLIDSAAVKAGKFQFRGNAQTPGVHYLLDSREGRPQAFAMQFILEPGNISIKSDAEDPQVRHTTGTPANDASDAYSAASRALIKEYRDQATTDERREAIERSSNN